MRLYLEIIKDVNGHNKRSVLLAISATTLFLIVTLAFAPVQFETNDDTFFLSVIAGYHTGTPTAFTTGGYVAISFSFFVSRLYMLLPTIPWYTVAQLFILWVSFSVVTFCIFDCNQMSGSSLTISFIGAVAFFSVVALPAVVLLQYTATSAAPAGAAIALLVHYKKSSRAYLILTVLATSLLMAFSFSVRMQTFYLCAALFLCVAFICYLRDPERRSHLLMLTVIPLAISGSLYVVEFATYHTPEVSAFMEYNIARTQFTDYASPSYYDAPDIYSDAGIDYTEYKLFCMWWFLLDKGKRQTGEYIEI